MRGHSILQSIFGLTLNFYPRAAIELSPPLLRVGARDIEPRRRHLLGKAFSSFTPDHDMLKHPTIIESRAQFRCFQANPITGKLATGK
jgi:hypothetical protein